ncbi:hypothetical protein VTN96DRAFT_6657 [Rasamsonia emersonii]
MQWRVQLHNSPNYLSDQYLAVRERTFDVWARDTLRSRTSSKYREQNQTKLSIAAMQSLMRRCFVLYMMALVHDVLRYKGHHLLSSRLQPQLRVHVLCLHDACPRPLRYQIYISQTCGGVSRRIIFSNVCCHWDIPTTMSPLANLKELRIAHCAHVCHEQSAGQPTISGCHLRSEFRSIDFVSFG